MTKTFTSTLAKAFTGALVALVLFGFIALPSASALTSAQVSAIISLLQSFGADAQTIANVNASLTGGTPTGSTGGSVSVPTGLTVVSNLSKARGQVTTDWQKALNLYNASKGGSLFAPLVEDGVYGSKTTAAVRAFQTSYGGGLTRDGLPGSRTAAAMNAWLATQGTGNPTNPPVTGALNVTLASSNPGAGQVLQGQSAADLLHLTFNGNGTVTNLTLQRKGISSNNTVSNVYLFDGAQRLTDAAAITSNGQVTFNVPAGLFTVNGSKTVSVRADIDSTATSGQTIGFDFVSAMAGTSPIAGMAMGNLSTVIVVNDLAIVDFNGTVTPSGAQLQPGTDVTVWQSNVNVSQRNVYLNRLALRQVGSAQASSFQNFKLYVNGVVVATAAGVDANGYVTFAPTSQTTLQSGSRVLRVSADIVSGASRTVDFELRSKADASFTDSQYGVNAAMTVSSGTFTSVGSVTPSTISGASGGSLTIEKDVTSASGNVIDNGTDVSLGTFKLSAFGEPIKIENLRAGVTSSDSSIGSLRNGRLLIDGVQYGSTATLEDIGTGTTYTVNRVIYPGQPVMVEIRADIYDNDGTDNASSGDTITAQLLAGSSNAVRQDSLGSFNSPASSVASNSLTVSSATVSLSKNTTYANQTVALPQTALKIGSWTLTGSSIEDILINQFSLDIDEVSGATFNEDDITNLYIRYGASGTTTPLPAASAADNTWSANYTLAKNSNLTIELYASLGSTVTSGNSFKTDLTVSGISLSSGVAVSASDIDGQTIASGSASSSIQNAGSPTAAIIHDNQTKNVGIFQINAVNTQQTLDELTVVLASTSNVANIILRDGSTEIARKPASTTTTFTGLANAANKFVVSANGNKMLYVDLELASAEYPNTAGNNVKVTITSGKTIPATGGQVSFTGPVSGNNQYVYAAIPTVEAVGGTQLGTLFAGQNTFSNIRISATGGTISWNQLFWDVNKTTGFAVTTSTLAVYTNGVLVPGVFTTTGLTSGATTGTVQFVPTDEEIISSSKTYELRATVTGTVASGANITFTIANDSSAIVPQNTFSTIQTNDTDAPIIWSDRSAQSHSETTTDWTTDYGVLFLPVQQTRSYNS